MKNNAAAEASMGNTYERESQEVILGREYKQSNKRSTGHLWQKVRAKNIKTHTKEDRTITCTSEVELEIEPAAGHNPERSPQTFRHREATDERPLPALPPYNQ